MSNSPYRGAYRNLLDAPVEEEVVTEAPKEEAPAANAEEETFKQRYGNLRRHQQKTEEDLKSRIATLEAQLKETAGPKLPKTKDEVAAWMRDFPDVAGIVKTMIGMDLEEAKREVDTKFKEIDNLKRQTAREKAEAELFRLHPDFNEVRADKAFHEWAGEQPKWVQSALYENDTDAHAAARAVDLYKSDMNISKKQTKRYAGADEAISTKRASAAPEGDGKNYISESQVERMSAVEYERNAEEINKAIREGRFKYDLSGASR
jgi:hypothetical protein